MSEKTDGPKKNVEALPEETILELIEKAEDDRTLNATLKLARIGILEVAYDEEDGEFVWWLSEQAVKMYEEKGPEAVENYIRASERPGIDKQELTRVLRSGGGWRD